MVYDDEGIRQQFPVHSTGSKEEAATEGVRVHGYSYLSYSPTILSGAPQTASGSRSYYRQAVDVATLVYTTAVPEKAQDSVMQLGVNGLLGSSFGISSVAYYSVATLEEAAQADSMKCELEFYCKDSSSSYSIMPEEQAALYDASFEIELGGKTLTGGKDGDISFRDKCLTSDVPVTIKIPLTIKTGSKFSGTYSNYMVKLTVSLWKNGAKIEGSTATDYIIYTNAKILTTLVQG